jgi:ubiquitin carboxyl-terminal hydrolase L5
MLREFGVKGVKVQEVISLDEEMMAFLKYELLAPHSCCSLRTNASLHSKPIYGLIFLFRWREDDANKQEAACPDGVWFANQVSRPVTDCWCFCSELLLI